MKTFITFCLGLAALVTAAPTAVDTQGDAHTDLAFSPAFWAIIVFAKYDDDDLKKRDSTASTAVVYTRDKDGKVIKRDLADADAILATTYLAVDASEDATVLSRADTDAILANTYLAVAASEKL